MGATAMPGHDHGDWQHRWAQQEARGELVESWWALAGGRPGLRVLDVGTGAGNFALRYAHLTGPTGHVHAVDVDAAALAHLLVRADVVHHAHLTTERLDVEVSRPPDLRFDVAFITDMLHHAREPVAALRHVLETPVPLAVISEFDPDQPGNIGPPQSMRVAPDVVRGWLIKAGWEVVSEHAQAFEHHTFVAAAPARV